MPVAVLDTPTSQHDEYAAYCSELKLLRVYTSVTNLPNSMKWKRKQFFVSSWNDIWVSPETSLEYVYVT